MRVSLTEAEQALRDEAHAFVRAQMAQMGSLPAHLDDRMEYLRTWQRQCYAAGYIGRSWPTQAGGLGRDPGEQMIIDEAFAAAGAPPVAGVVGLLVLGPALLEFGTDEQRRRYLQPILEAQEIWCQGFSEPEAGSDLASLRARAVDDGDAFVLSGQKTWTSWAQYARWCGVLAKTEKDGPKHRQISLLLVDMQADGVTVAPINQITGQAEFSEVFFDDVRVPKAQLLGERGQGWSIAMHALGHERGTAALRGQIRIRTMLNRLVADAQHCSLDGERLLDRTDVQRRLGRAFAASEVVRHHAYRTVGRALNGGAVGPESSSVRLALTAAHQEAALLAMDVLGTSLAGGDDGPLSETAAEWHETYLHSRAVSVYGGSEQIQRNIIADRVLRLPRE